MNFRGRDLGARVQTTGDARRTLDEGRGHDRDREFERGSLPGVRGEKDPVPVIAPRVRAAFRSCVYARSSQSPRQVRSGERGSECVCWWGSSAEAGGEEQGRS